MLDKLPSDHQFPLLDIFRTLFATKIAAEHYLNDCKLLSITAVICVFYTNLHIRLTTCTNNREWIQTRKCAKSNTVNDFTCGKKGEKKE